jgi:hypothetical protein
MKGGRPTDKFPVVCTTYEMVLKDRSLLSRINWEFIIIVRHTCCHVAGLCSQVTGRGTPDEEF